MYKIIILCFCFLVSCSNPIGNNERENQNKKKVSCYIKYKVTRAEQGDLFVWCNGNIISTIPRAYYTDDSANCDTVTVVDSSILIAEYYFPRKGILNDTCIAEDRKLWIVGQ